MLIKQSTAAKAIPFFMVDATDHISGKTGLTTAVTISKNGAAFGAPAGVVTEVGSGWYKIAANATDSNTIGSLLVHATATGADPFDVEHEVIEATLAKGTDITGFVDITTAQVQAELVTYGGLKPTTAGRTLDVTATGEAGLDFDNTVGTIAKGTDITGFTDLSAANIQTELVNYGALKPTTAGRTLDVTATGEAGVDWSNIGAPTTTVALTGTTIGTVTNLTNDPPGVTTLLARVTSTLFTGVTSFKEWLGLLAGKQVGNATARTEIRSSGAGSGTFDETTDSQEALRDRGDAAWITGAGGDPWATLIPAAYGAGTAGNILGNRVDVAVSTRATPAQVQTELANYGALKPTVAARTLDVSAGGEAGVDWANVGTPATTNNLSATTIATTGTLTNAPPDSSGVTTLLTRIPATLFSGVTSLAQWLGLIAGKQVGNATARTELRATGAGSGTYDETTDSQEATRDRGDAAWISAGSDPWLTALPGAYGAGTAGSIVGNNLNATVSSRATQASVDTIGTNVTGIKSKTDNLPVDPADASDVAASFTTVNGTLSTISGYIDTEVGAIKAKTDQLTFGPNGVNCDVTLDAADLAALADAVLKRDFTLVSGEAAYSLLNAARMLRSRWDTAGGTLTVRKEDGTTVAWTRALSVDPTAQPIVGAT